MPKSRPARRPKARSKDSPRKKTPARARAASKRVMVEASSRGSQTPDWRERTLARVRELILEAHPAMTEERKWKKPSNPAGVPTWSQDGIICTSEIYKAVVKLTFARGASLPDPSRLFNASLDGNQRRAIDIHEGVVVDADAFKKLILAAVARNGEAKSR